MAEIDIAYIPPEAGKRIWRATREVERMAKIAEFPFEQYAQTPIYVRNDSGLEIPSFGCMQVKDVETIEGQNYCVVRRPIAWTGALVGPFLFNSFEAIPVGKFGVAQSGQVIRAIKDSTTMTVGMRLGHASNSFQVTKGCLYSYLGPDEIRDDIIKIVRNETPILGITDEEIPGNGEGDVTKKDPSSGDWVAGSTVYVARNPSPTPIPASTLVMLFPIDAKWAAVAIC